MFNAFSSSGRSKEAPMEFEYERKNTDVFSSGYPGGDSNKKRAHSSASNSFSEHFNVTPTSNAVKNEDSNSDGKSEHSVDPPITGSKFLFSLPPSTASSEISALLNTMSDDLGSLSVRSKERAPIATNAIRKVRRRRELNGNRLHKIARRENETDSESENEHPEKDSKQRSSDMWGPSASIGNDKRPNYQDIPLIVSGYLQLFFNIFLIAVLLYLVTQFIQSVQRDVDLRVEEYSAEILQEMSQCSKNYLENRCSPETRVPAMEKACRAWESCMNRDPKVIGRAKVSAETFAEIINSFIEPISYKTMLFFLALVFGSLFVSNFAFGFYRSHRINIHRQDDPLRPHVISAPYNHPMYYPPPPPYNNRYIT
ncbi:uncharacterized protein VTP21DRAFT_3625 [Calcarisporiella thermophila]|uniref:uncharacterized protein n=1 Tax=Calcarisporiella thermophila TaxID=911321 RepID=UPI00374281E7